MKRLIIITTCLTMFMQVVKSQETKSTTLSVVNGDICLIKTAVKTQDNSTKSIKLSSINGNNYCSYQTQSNEDGITKSKALTKSFDITRSDKINIANRFGSITIKTWDKDEIKVDADIKAYAVSEEEAQKLLDNVFVSTSKNENGVSFKTNIRDDSGSWGYGSKRGKKWRREVRVNLTVYMPTNNPLNASQEYGNIVMSNFDGPTIIKVEYGNFTAGILNNTSNSISVEFGKGNITEVKNARIKHEYGDGFTIGTVDNLNIDAQYTSVAIGTIKGNATIKHEYGSGLNIGSVGALNLDAQYTNVKIKMLTGNAVSRIEYAKLAIEEIKNNCKNLCITSDYSSIKLGFQQNYNADFEIDTDYTSFNYGDNVTAKKIGEDEEEKGFVSSKKYIGKVGNGGNARIRIIADYGSISFK